MIVVDADHLSFRSASSCEPTKAKPFLESKEEAIWRLHSMVEQIYAALNTKDMEFYIAGEGNWRRDIYPEYKANRVLQKKPTYLEDVREILVVQYGAKLVNGREVDDECGIRMTQLQEQGCGPICVSLDKDLYQIPGRHYNFVKMLHTTVSPLDGLKNFYKQIITGDASDNVPAFDGAFRSAVPKFVQKLLDPIDEMDNEKMMWTHVLDIYKSLAPRNELDYYEFAVRNAKILYIQRKEGDVWQPPGQREENEASSSVFLEQVQDDGPLNGK